MYTCLDISAADVNCSTDPVDLNQKILDSLPYIVEEHIRKELRLIALQSDIVAILAEDTNPSGIINALNLRKYLEITYTFDHIDFFKREYSITLKA